MVNVLILWISTFTSLATKTTELTAIIWDSTCLDCKNDHMKENISYATKYVYTYEYSQLQFY